MNHENIAEEAVALTSQELKKFLTISIDNEIYGIDIEHVNDINRIQEITEVPNQDHYVMGIINLRGQIVPVIDIRRRFVKNEIEYDDRTCIIVIRYEENIVGLIVDRVVEVLSIPISLLTKTDSNDQKSKFIMGITKYNDQIITLLDIERILFD
ncbi:chemotaxis protein CheW [Fusibacter paucivorans]|uniref:Chemotaxis protein CheW n=1 Tax=Fusibacter paucivorans TaxID=76009 RepID=A0ABS5PS61_9FIRM|nr:chemotaxis protein CheW [Fusibacter paucivorans]MBS7527707.1 chemotaxis protein CheW [Fusibacter paucivorans]